MNTLALFSKTDHARFPVPRQFQNTAHEKLREGIKRGHRSQILVAPTGAGKSYIGLRIINEALQKDRRALFVCDRTALIDQTSERADEYGLSNHGIVQANHWRRDNLLPFQIASIQTIATRGYWPDADVVVIDECHSQYSATKEFLQRTRAAVIGLTATPCSPGLGIYYTNMVNAATMNELTESGVLVPMRILSCLSPDMAGAATSGGEWTAKAAGERESQIVGDVVAEWQKHAANRKTIAFGADIAHCTGLCQRFNEAGIGAALYTSETGDIERKELLKEFIKPNPTIRVLISVEALAKGFDVQDIGCVIDARPLRKSISTAIQMWGRGLRSFPGKTECLLLDHSGNIRRFYDDFVDIYFSGFHSLSTAEKLDASPREELEYTPAGCPKCSRKPFRKRCLACGFEQPIVSLESAEPGTMHEIRIGKKVIASNAYDLWTQVCAYARQHSVPEKQAGRAWNLFRDITGQKSDWKFESTPDAPISSGTAGKIRQLNIKFVKSRKRVVA